MSGPFGSEQHICYVCLNARVPNSGEKLIRCIGKNNACQIESSVETFNDHDGGFGSMVELLDDGDDVRAAIEQVERWAQFLQSGHCDACDGDRYFHSSCVAREPSLGNINTLVNFDKQRKHARFIVAIV